MVESFLTEKQKKVLELREKGLTQEAISEIIDTSRSNVCLIEKRARENLNRSKETIKDWHKVFTPVKVLITEGTDVLDVPELVYKEANKADIKVDLSTINVVEKIKDQANELLNKREVEKDFKLYVRKNGDILIEKNDSF